MKNLIIAAMDLAWITFKSGFWVPVAGLYAVQHMGALPHIPAATALLMML